MHPNAILHEIRRLYNVSDRLDLLAEQHPLVSDALIGSISGSIRNAATLREVVVAMRMPTLAQIPQMPELQLGAQSVVPKW